MNNVRTLAAAAATVALLATPAHADEPPNAYPIEVGAVSPQSTADGQGIAQGDAYVLGLIDSLVAAHRNSPPSERVVGMHPSVLTRGGGQNWNVHANALQIRGAHGACVRGCRAARVQSRLPTLLGARDRPILRRRVVGA